MAGFFITFEGGEGTGKTTQINRLAKSLAEGKRHVMTTREPGGTPEGEKIRNLLVQKSGGAWDAVAECLLLFAARRMHVETVIKPALADGALVISDRFTDSTRAYQGYGHGMALEKIEEMNKLAINGFEPQRTFILDIDPADGLARSERRLASEALKINQSEDKYEGLELAFHERLRKGFLDIAKKNSKRCVVIDASQSQDDIAAQILKIVLKDIGQG